MKRPIRSNDFEKMSSAELLDLVSADFHAATKETLATVDLQLETAHKCDEDDEELLFAWSALHLMREKYDEHVQKEERLLFPLLSVSKGNRNETKGQKEVEEFIAELKEEHKWLKTQFGHIRKATHEYECEIDSFPSQKLAYAQLNNLEQDFNRVIFIEEEYLFPRILRQQFK